MKFGFIGAGNLASALVYGAAQTSFIKENEFFAYDVFEPSLKNIEHYGVHPLNSVNELIRTCDTVVLSVKPKDLPSLLTENKELFKEKSPFIVSVAAGTEISYIASYLDYDARIARIMPNINAAVCGSATAICCASGVTPQEKQSLIAFCKSFGEAFEISEDMFAVFGVVGGCSPAFNYMYIDQLARAAVRFGMKKEQALRIAAQAVKGSALRILEGNEHPYDLIDKVCSPGGTTIEGVTALQANGFENAVNAAVEAAYNKDCKMREKK